MITSDLAKIYTAIIAHLATEVPEIKHVDLDYGQLSNFQVKPQLGYPAVLVDFVGWQTSNLGENAQEGLGSVSITLVLDVPVPSSNHMTELTRERALYYFELEYKLHQALHGFAPIANAGYMTRTSFSTVKGPMGLRLRGSMYHLHIEDFSTEPSKTLIPLPGIEWSGEIN